MYNNGDNHVNLSQSIGGDWLMDIFHSGYHIGVAHDAYFAGVIWPKSGACVRALLEANAPPSNVHHGQYVHPVEAGFSPRRHNFTRTRPHINDSEAHHLKTLHGRESETQSHMTCASMRLMHGAVAADALREPPSPQGSSRGIGSAHTSCFPL